MLCAHVPVSGIEIIASLMKLWTFFCPKGYQALLHFMQYIKHERQCFIMISKHRKES